MTSPALTYLNAKTVYWINIERMADRARAWQEVMRPHFHAATRVQGLDWQDVSDEVANRFVADWNRLWRHHRDNVRREIFMHAPQSASGYRARTARANFAIRYSHLAALERGISSRLPRFMVSEDDLRPRDALLGEDVKPPPPDADLAIWSGGLPMAAVRTDDREYERGALLRWVRVKQEHSFNTLGAGLYEVSDDVARHLHSIISDNPMGPFDHCWGIALMDLRVYRMRPNAFAQFGPSIRNTVTRTPVTERDAVRS